MNRRSGEAADGLESLWYGVAAWSRVARAALAPLAAAFGAASALRGALYDRGVAAVRRAPRPVVSVGSLRVGGAGKTPFVLWLVARLQQEGYRPCIVLRGYGGEAGASPILLDAESATDPRAVERAGDEAVLLALRSGVPVVAGADRQAACVFAIARLAGTARDPDLFVLDDGFQHRALARDVDIVLVAGSEASERLLPAGPLREAAGALARADAVVLVAGEPDPAFLGARPHGALAVCARTRARALVRSVGEADGQREDAGRDVRTLAGRRVVAVAAIARPGRFLRELERLGAVVVARVLRRDHHRYDAADVAEIEAAAAAADFVVTTEKDLVKLQAMRLGAAPLALRIELEVDDGDAIVDLVRARALSPARFDR